MPGKKYRIGARGSLLSVTQSTITKNELERLTGDEFEIITIKTQGDQIQDKPLWQLEGKDFFTKELDAALLKDEVDLVIHSYKDLGSERPEGIQLAAITKRQFAHDILLIKRETVKNLPTIEGEFIIGTSSPRRITNIERKIADFLPHFQNKTVKCQTLRGNVNTRIQKILDGQYHAIVLALAGIERLAQHPDSLTVLKDLLKDLTFCVLPLSAFPAAASQGALAIEINSNRSDNGELAEKLKIVNCDITVAEMKRERAAFQSYGGGCHLAVGIHTRKIGEQFVQFEQGRVDNTLVDKKHSSLEVKKVDEVFTGMPSKVIFDTDKRCIPDQILIKTPIQNINTKAANIFITSSYCLSSIDKTILYSSLWSSGIKTHQRLIKGGFWVNGCADIFGQDEIENLRSSKAIQLMLTSQDWYTHSNKDSKSTLGEKFEAYQKTILHPNEDYVKEIEKLKHFYWTSFNQYEVYTNLFKSLKDESVKHYCGLGKTFEEFQNQKINVTPIFSIKELI